MSSARICRIVRFCVVRPSQSSEGGDGCGGRGSYGRSTSEGPIATENEATSGHDDLRFVKKLSLAGSMLGPGESFLVGVALHGVGGETRHGRVAKAA